MENFSEDQGDKMLNGMVEGPISDKSTEPSPTEIEEPPADGRNTPELDFKEGKLIIFILIIPYYIPYYRSNNTLKSSVPDSPYLQEKAKQIEVALEKTEILIEDLQKYALSEGGFVNGN
jgi:hypothetical protein